MELKEEYHPDGKGFEMICIGGMGADFFKARGIQPLYIHDFDRSTKL